ncbi:hypothetical protein EDB85DRAFT_318333 [Lactarius pseudohatsudake]|nr:hypothetical protein EDB85DRAFT_318333 [Lactarius pseudohatsudake]
MSKVCRFPTLMLDIFDETGQTVWRTSTPEQGDGIIWTYLKDVTRFIPLFSEPGTFLQFDNVVETGLDGEYANYEFDHSYRHILIPPPFILGTTIVERQLPGGGIVKHRADW